MIIQEIKIINNIEYKYTYSDRKKFILQKETGIMYEDALDRMNFNYTYEETNIDIYNQEEL